ncbi:MAG: YbjN domain-containing protein [Chloroflexi bacterium]|nr:YbjN domain-containing protein [Chloroflexota bacterium]
MFNFGGRRPTPSLENHAQTVEQILLSLGVELDKARMNTHEGFGWRFMRGSALIEVYISQREEIGYFQVLSPILHLPQIGLLPLYRRLLELNLQLTNAAFGVYFETVYVFSERQVAGMDANEANSVIAFVANCADAYDDQLVNEFGGRLYNHI